MVGLSIVAACQPLDAPSASATPTATNPSDVPTATADLGAVIPTQSRTFDRVSSTAAPELGEAPDDIMDTVVRAARATLGLPADAPVSIVRAEAVTWPDGSLGCPEPGGMYLATPTSGYWIEIEAADRRLDYRVTRDGNFRLCPR